MDLAANQISHEHEAGFVPPLVPSNTLPYSSTSSSNYTVTVTTSAQGLFIIFFCFHIQVNYLMKLWKLI